MSFHSCSRSLVRLAVAMLAMLAFAACGGEGNGPSDNPKEPCPAGCMANEVCSPADVCECKPGFLNCDGEAANGCEFEGTTCPDGCVAESEEALCAREGLGCGIHVLIDNCGTNRTADCGGCDPGESCNAGVCVDIGCQSEDDAAFCQRLERNCGVVEDDDNCSVPRTVDCGGCPIGQSCGVVEDNVCGCVAETDAALCDRLGKDCGTLTATDTCGTERTVVCGSCEAGELCGAEVANVCGDEPCAPSTDEALCLEAGKNCGDVRIEDECGTLRDVNCGSCPIGQECGLDVANVCADEIACEPENTAGFCARLGKDCGEVTADDNCGVERTETCGTCTGDDECNENVCTEPCVPETDEAHCARRGKNCGETTGLDNCGDSRTVECGTCENDWVCGVTQPNVCEPPCVGQTAEQLCQQHSACGQLTAVDSCGVTRTVECSTCAPGQVCDTTTNMCVASFAPENSSCYDWLWDELTECDPGLSCVWGVDDWGFVDAGCKRVCNQDSDCGGRTCMLGTLQDGSGVCADTVAPGGAGCADDFFYSSNLCFDPARPAGTALYCVEPANTCEYICSYSGGGGGTFPCPAGQTCGPMNVNSQFGLVGLCQ